MRYLLPLEQRAELSGRQAYLFGIFHVYFVVTHVDHGFMTLVPFPFTDHYPSILFITGHADQVYRYLECQFQEVSESSIVITSCFSRIFSSFSRDRTIYVPAESEYHAFCFLRDGKLFGFDFDISDAELNLYNSRGSLHDRILSAYVPLSQGGISL